jgi:heat-inducible transcriptional repressor
MRHGFGGNLNARQAQILGAIVTEHVRTAQPVGSKAVRERYGVGASTATIRNEMAVLEDAGYIRQPHTSAGRVPANKGYRAYVDRVMSEGLPARPDLAWVHGEYRRMARELDTAYRATSRLLSRLTRYPAMVMTPGEPEPTFTMIRMSPVSATNVLLRYATSDGEHHQHLVRLSQPVPAAVIEAISGVLERALTGHAISDVDGLTARTLQEQLPGVAVPEDLLAFVQTVVTSPRRAEVYVDGAAYALAQPEFEAREALGSVIEALDETGTVTRLLRSGGETAQVTVRIGEEIELPSLHCCSVVVRSYAGPASRTGAVGVLGPTRMDYRQAAAIVNYIADEVERLAAQRAAEEEQ